MGTRVLGTDGALPEGPEKRRAVEEMFDRVAPDYDRVNRVISLGRDRAWRARTVESLSLGPGARVLDLACGTGDLTRDAAHAGYAPVGVDISAGMLHAGDCVRAVGAGRRRRPPVRIVVVRRCRLRVRAAQLRRAPDRVR